MLSQLTHKSVRLTDCIGLIALVLCAGWHQPERYGEKTLKQDATHNHLGPDIAGTIDGRLTHCASVLSPMFQLREVPGKQLVNSR